VDIAVIGGGASGLAAAIWAARHVGGHELRVAVLEGAPRIGAKIMVSGGGRCNVTNQAVTAADYWGTSPAVIRNVLRAFDVPRTIAWFAAMGVELVPGEGGKFFPSTNKAATVRDALVREAADCGCALFTGARVEELRAVEGGFELAIPVAGRRLRARRRIVATGGMAMPRSGSDGAGLEWLRALGHTIVEPVPALVPLVLRAGAGPGGQFAELAGIAFSARVRYTSRLEGRRFETRGPVLFTHFGVSGPAILDISRHVTRDLRAGGPPVALSVGHEAFASVEEAAQWLRSQRQRAPRRTLAHALAELYPLRLAELLAGQSAGRRLGELRADEMAEAARNLAALPLEVVGDRGFAGAEVTAGGVDLREVNWRSLESRLVPGLHLCGEVLDVDGRIGGFNFQWAWSSGFVAGRGAARGLLDHTG